LLLFRGPACVFCAVCYFTRGLLLFTLVLVLGIKSHRWPNKECCLRSLSVCLIADPSCFPARLDWYQWVFQPGYAIFYVVNFRTGLYAFHLGFVLFRQSSFMFCAWIVLFSRLNWAVLHSSCCFPTGWTILPVCAFSPWFYFRHKGDHQNYLLKCFWDSV
jgi:hypothetical protein